MPKSTSSDPRNLSRPSGIAIFQRKGGYKLYTPSHSTPLAKIFFNCSTSGGT